MHEYMLLTAGKYEEWKKLSPDKNQRHMEAHFAFIETLPKKQRDVAGSAVAQGGYELRRKGAAVVTDGPFVQNKEMLNGFMTFKAESVKDAVLPAKECPAHGQGEKVQVFEMAGM